MDIIMNSIYAMPQYKKIKGFPGTTKAYIFKILCFLDSQNDVLKTQSSEFYYLFDS